ncbi:TraX family protein [Bacillota bacterium Meth-B3]|nr:TraX family protein [Christensenellaceae bacterium]MEA5066802.1 TraX family protein [Eubacteriales bacterium]MEA5069694.1 TraX family protein [Christensenellaceae bacterium]
MTAARGGIRLNTDTGFLKIIAMITMVIDHVGAVFYPGLTVMRIIGRIAFPIYAYCIAVGCVYTRNIAKYALRVLVLAVVSQPIYVIALRHITPAMSELMQAGLMNPLNLLKWYGDSLRYANILFTLLFGILMIWSLKEKKYVVTGVLTLAVFQLSGFINYGWRGVAMMLIFHAFIDRPTTSFLWMAGFMTWWGLTTGSSNSLFGVQFALQTYALLALPLIYIPTKTQWKLPKWAFYLFYPAHLAAIYGATLLLR